MKKLMVYMLAMVLLGAWGTPLYSAEQTKLDGNSLFKKKCGLCHGLRRVKSKRKTAEEWQKTVMRMKNANGCPITDEEAKAIIQYLSGHYGK